MSAAFEDSGLVTNLLGRLQIHTGYFVEFGAWDGVRMSNTVLLRQAGWRGLLIEADAAKFAALSRNVTEPAVRLLHCTVEASGENALDAIFAREGCPEEIDFLSIDIDSDDLAVWKSLETYRARCVAIEFNPTIPFDTHFENPKGRNWGNSALAITAHARSANYVLVGITVMNLLFADRALAERCGVRELALETANAPFSPRQFWGFDGTLVVARSEQHYTAPEILSVPWHSYAFAQPMPKRLRFWKVGEQRYRHERLSSLLTLALLHPFALLKALRRSKPAL